MKQQIQRQGSFWLDWWHQLSVFKDLGTFSLSTLAHPLAEGKISADVQYFSRSVLARSVVSNSLQPLWTVAHQVPLSMGIFQARILEWVAQPFSKGSSQPRDWIRVSHLAGRFFTIWPTSHSKESPSTEAPGRLHSRWSDMTNNFTFQVYHNTIPQTHKEKGLKQQTFFLSEFWKAEVQDQVLAGSRFFRGLLLDLQMASFSLCPHMVFPLCMHP